LFFPFKTVLRCVKKGGIEMYRFIPFSLLIQRIKVLNFGYIDWFYFTFVLNNLLEVLNDLLNIKDSF